MANLPAPREPGPVGPVSPHESQLVEDGEIRLRQVVAMLSRSKWLLLAGTLLGYAAARIYTDRAERVYEASTTLRIDRREPNLPTIFENQRGSDLETDIQVLQSRSLVGEAVRQLALRVKVYEPTGITRKQVLDSIRLDEEASVPSSYLLIRQGDGSYAVYTNDTGDGEPAARVSPGERVT